MVASHDGFELRGRDKSLVAVAVCPIHLGGVTLTVDNGEGVVSVEFEGGEALDVADALRHYHDISQASGR